MNILTSRKAAMFARASDLPEGAVLDGRSWNDAEDVNYRRVYRETVIVDDDLILIGVPTGESELVPMLTPAG